MTINRYRLTSKVTLPSGTFLADDNSTGTASTAVGVGAPANFGTGSFAQGSGKWGSGAGGAAGGSTTWLQGMELLLDPTGPLYTAIGAGNLVQITAVDDVGHSGLSN
jgi:hypothetical protein